MAEIHSSNADNAHVQGFFVDPKFYAGQPGVADFHTHKLTDAGLEADNKLLEIASRSGFFGDSEFRVEAAASRGVSSSFIHYDLLQDFSAS